MNTHHGDGKGGSTVCVSVGRYEVANVEAWRMVDVLTIHRTVVLPWRWFVALILREMEMGKLKQKRVIKVEVVNR